MSLSPHFIDEMGAQRGLVTCSGLHSKQAVEVGSQPSPRAHAQNIVLFWPESVLGCWHFLGLWPFLGLFLRYLLFLNAFLHVPGFTHLSAAVPE